MKTLDELIFEAPYLQTPWEADALHYLREYSSNQDTIAEQLAELEQKNDHVCEMAKTICEKYDRLCNRLAEEYRNDALSWDELRQMEGKPVWIEYGCDFNQKRWVIIHSFHNTRSFCYMNVSGNYPNTFWQKDMGEDEFWQAYRKEREK